MSVTANSDLSDSSHIDSGSLPLGGKGESLWAALTWVLGLRAIIFVLGVISVTYAPAGMFPSSMASGAPWVAFDGIHYLEIARHGYPRGEGFALIAFFPLLPMAARALGALMPMAAAIVVFCNLCSLAGSAVFYVWCEKLAGRRTAFFSTLFLNCFTGAVFLNAALTEGPFLLLVAGVLLLMQQRQFWWAAGVCALASLTRPTAMAVAGVLVIYAFMQWRSTPVARRAVLCILLGLFAYSGALSYQAWLGTVYGDWKIYAKAQATWETGADQIKAKASEEAAAAEMAALKGQVTAPAPPKRFSAAFFMDRLLKPQAWNYALAAGLLLLTLLGLWKGFGAPRVLFLLPLAIWLLGALPGRGLRISSLHRYEMGGLPLFLLVGALLVRCRWSWARWIVLSLFFGVQMYYAWLFQRGVWVG